MADGGGVGADVVLGWNAMLGRWRGAEAQIFRVNVLDGARIVLFRGVDRDVENLTIDVVGPSWFRGPVGWSDADLTIREVGGGAVDRGDDVVEPVMPDRGFELVDPGCGFLMIGEDLRVVENEDLRGLGD